MGLKSHHKILLNDKHQIFEKYSIKLFVEIYSMSIVKFTYIFSFQFLNDFYGLISQDISQGWPCTPGPYTFTSQTLGSHACTTMPS